MSDATDDLLTPENLTRLLVAFEEEDARRTAAEVRAACRALLPEALGRLIQLAATARNPKVRHQANRFLQTRMRQAGIDVGALLAGESEGPPS